MNASQISYTGLDIKHITHFLKFFFFNGYFKQYLISQKLNVLATLYKNEQTAKCGQGESWIRSSVN